MQQHFTMPKGMYLLSHSVGCLPKNTQTTLNERYLSTWSESGGDAWPAWLGIIDDFCAELATLLGANSQDFCPQSNLSSGLTKYLMALPKHPKRNKILMHASAFPSMGFVVQGLAGLGYELKLIDESHCPRDLNVWQEHLNDTVAAALITHVHSNTGIQSPVADIAKLCAEHGAKSMVDIAQSAGIVPVFLSDWQVDVAFGSCVKWLCGGPGAGFMWLNPQNEQLHPVDIGWFSHENPFEFDIRNFAYANGAKRFWGGTPSVAPYAMALGSIILINNIGIDTISAHNCQLSKTLLEAAQGYLQKEINLTHNGGTLCMELQPTLIDSLQTKLTQLGAHFDRRGNSLRLSLHIYNTQEEAEQLAEVFNTL